MKVKEYKKNDGSDENLVSIGIENYRKLIRENPHFCTYRWSKKLMLLYINEVPRIGGDAEDALDHLNVSF